ELLLDRGGRQLTFEGGNEARSVQRRLDAEALELLARGDARQRVEERADDTQRLVAGELEGRAVAGIEAATSRRRDATVDQRRIARRSVGGAVDGRAEALPQDV